MESGMPVITGQSGPFGNVPGTPGAQGAQGVWGGNAAHNALSKLGNLSDQVELALSTIQVTPGDTFQTQGLSPDGLANYFRFAETEIAHFDRNGDRQLDVSELQPIFGDNAATFKQAIDQDGIDGVGVLDATAYLMAQDGTRQLLHKPDFETFRKLCPDKSRQEQQAIYNSIPDVKDYMALAQQTYADIYQNEFPGETLPEMAFDGQVTPAEAHAFNRIIQNQQLNAAAGAGMQLLQEKLGLQDRYLQYLDRQ
ncbi:MAG: hypothetical protein AB7P76_12245 [Candidatus Melainabacteria bacterium]